MVRIMKIPKKKQLGSGDYDQILRRTRLSEDQLKEVLALIQTLDPNPGQSAVPDEVEYVVPDVFVSKKKWPLAGRTQSRYSPKTAH